MQNNIDLDSLNLTQEQILNTENGESEDTSDSSIHNMDEERQDDFLFADLINEGERRAQEQRLRHTEEEHDLRKKHLHFLSKITIYWLGLITVVSYLQGFKGNGLITIYIKEEYLDKLPFYFSSPTFELTNPAFIALITTTTATILGLYTIAAIWLYKGKHEDKGQNKPNTNNEDTQ